MWMEDDVIYERHEDVKSISERNMKNDRTWICLWKGKPLKHEESLKKTSCNEKSSFPSNPESH